MGSDDARSLDHTTLEALRIRAVRNVQAGESPSAVALALGVTARTMYGWLAGALPARRLGRFDGQTVSRPAAEVDRARDAMDLRHGDAEEPAAAAIYVCIVDARDGGDSDQEEIQHHASRQFRWPVVGAARHHLPEAIASSNRTR